MKKSEARASQFPTIDWVDAKKRIGAIDLIFGIRIDGQGVVSKSAFRGGNGKA
jgi:hypothetical protein